MAAVSVLVKLIEALPAVVAAAPEFVNLFNEFLKSFKEDEQAELKSAYQRARQASDSAQQDFTEASKGN